MIAAMEPFIGAIKDTLSSDQILTEEAQKQQYDRDKMPDTHYLPDVVLVPNSHEEIVGIVSAANTYKIPIIVRASGTSTTGGAMPIAGGVVVSLERLNRCLEIDLENQCAVIEPCLITAEFGRLVEEKGLFYPIDPASLNECSMGGNVAVNAGGPRALKYGVTGQYVMGISGVFGNGEPFEFGGKMKKNVAGYDLKSLLIGSEGTLGVITKIVMKLLPKPTHTLDALVNCDSIKLATDLLTQLYINHSQPAVAEFMDHQCLSASAKHLGIDNPIPDSPYTLLFQWDGNSDSSLTPHLKQLVTLCDKKTGMSVIPVTDPALSETIWAIRRNISYGLSALTTKMSEDIAVPISALETCLKSLRQIGEDCNITILAYGHIGDGNIHVNMLKLDCPDDQWEDRKNKAIPKIMQLAVDLGGTITGEHGVGLTKKAFMPLMFSDGELALMRQLKRVFDPQNILNPGKMLDVD